MRGKVTNQRKICTFTGITPAYAGKRALYSQLHQVFQDHPRLCGEKGSEAGLGSSGTGSPPPMRGKAGGAVQEGGDPRITPAYAGKRQGRTYPYGA